MARIADLAEEEDLAQLDAVFEKWDDAELGQLFSEIAEDHLPRAFHALAAERRPNVFELLDTARQVHLVEELPDADVAALLDAISPDDLTALLEDLSSVERQRALRIVKRDTRARALELLGYPDESVGRLMTPQYVALRPKWSVEKAMVYIRKHGPDSETIHTVYVVNEQGHLIDDIRLRRLILADPEQHVSDLMDHEFLSLSAMEDREEAVRMMQRYDVFVLPVVDRDGTLLGVVTVDDVLDVQEEEATEDFHKVGAVQPLSAGYRHTSGVALFKARIPWLLILIFVGVMTAGVITRFESTLENLLILAAFIPLIIGSGGNTGAQASTIMVRALATGDIGLREWWRTARKELGIGASLGIAMGLATFLLGYLLGSVLVGAIVGAAMFTVVLIANLLGMILPFILTLARRDPAVASAPLITTIVDVVGLLVYFMIASWALQRFG